MLVDLISIFYWWFILFALGIIFLPLANCLFKRFFDRGYLFSKTMAVLALSYLVWLGAHMKILPFTQATILAMIILAAMIIVVAMKKNLLRDTEKIKEKWPIFLLEEGLFLMALLFWSYIRSLQPDIQGLEKFMDFGFQNSILQSRYFPPVDMWFAGHTINYYYYGHYIAAFLTKLSGLKSSITYNLMIATLFASTFTLIFSLSANSLYLVLRKTERKKMKTFLIAGLLSALIACFASSFHTPLYALKNGNYWYPDATRYIGYNPDTADKTIHEFPAYSFIVADLHGHVSDIPSVLLFMALVLALLLRMEGVNWQKNVLKSMKPIMDLLLILGGLLGIIYMTNAWDFPIYLLLLGIALLAVNLRKVFTQKGNWLFKPLFQKLSRLLLITALPLLIVIFSALIVSLPFSLNFSQIASGIGLVHSHTPFYQLAVLWGAFSLFILIFSIFFIKRKKKVLSDYFVLFLAITAIVLIILPEIVYVKDIYSADYYRANTMFKFTFQAYLMLTVLTGYVVGRIAQAAEKQWFKISFLIFSLACLTAILIYPTFSIPGYYGDLALQNYQGLDGELFLAERYPADFQAIQWLKENANHDAIIVEAVGDSYTDYNRVSAFTGFATIEGWMVHEWLWRGGYDKPSQRKQEVAQIYQGTTEEGEEVLKKYRVDYLFFGELEKEKYPQANLEKLSLLGKIVYRAGGTVILAISS